ncbi:MAG TPA: MarR family transcriptional regulator [Conexibacter sp.]|nr:MarR family transcriptional regulator [Conexibacter sp.]
MAIVRTARRLRQESDTGGETSPTLTAALATIERRGPLTPSALADCERIRRPTATRVIAQLEALGLVTRTSDPHDRRVAHVAIAPAGRALLKRIRSRKNQYLARRLRELTPDEQRTLAEAAALLEGLLEAPPSPRPAVRARAGRTA